ncbi:Hypothetical protein NTJ_14579 [Nesidiocoris tenuis]|uniref:Uncharacterized protein n=1 Tax=Nesidiocoris tenuis TaxID=355587 RepID=A0ABN7BF58_9HEMI|nr:Hypothetical protein NTJ_14579 [Nesidiocoris tenuis]
MKKVQLHIETAKYISLEMTSVELSSRQSRAVHAPGIRPASDPRASVLDLFSCLAGRAEIGQRAKGWAEG